MGGRNVGCVLTGLEIREGDPVYMASLTEGQFDYEGHYIEIPPLKGVYDGYGGITLTEDVPCLGLKADDEYDEEDTKRVFVHPDIFDGLLDLEMSVGISFGSYILMKADDVSAALGDTRFFENAERKGVTERWIPVALTVNDALEEHSRSSWANAISVFNDVFEDQKKMESAQNLLIRGHLLKIAEMELRRPLVPFNWAPQDVGVKAREAVFQKAAQIAQRQADEDYGDEISGPPKI